MATIDHARKRVVAVLDEIDRLMQSEFPGQHPKDAMSILQDKFRKREAVLGKIGPNVPHDVSQQECSAALEQLFVYIPILGFILRSTNVRNGFESHGPLLRLVESLIGSGTKLIVSSEWEFSPFVYGSITDLPGFVLIGLPATESSNPLVIPLAGHELGHTVWTMYKLAADFNSRIRASILEEITANRWSKYREIFPQYERTDLDGNWFGELTWQPAFQSALRQAEEMFCDFLGVRLFAESYLHAFAYLIAPGTSGQRSLGYPDIRSRVSYIVDAAKDLQVEVPDDFIASFLPDSKPVDPTTAFLVSVADTVVRKYAQELLGKAREAADSKMAALRNPENVSNIAARFKDWVVPTAEPQSLVDVLCAGWECRLDGELWTHVRQIESADWRQVLRDLMFKSMEVSEIHERLEKAGRLREQS